LKGSTRIPIGGSWPFEGFKVRTPIQCTGVPVSPGDIVVVDGNGVVVVPREDSAAILQAAQHLQETEPFL